MSASPLILIVDTDIKSLEQRRDEFGAEWNCISVGRELSSYLILQDQANTSQLIYKWINDYIRDKSSYPVLCSDVDILFHPSLQLDPLNMFRQISRHVNLVVLWPGSFKDGVLSYAQPEHQHYRFWKNLEGIEIKGVNDAL